jgi:hypothetical protein
MRQAAQRLLPGVDIDEAIRPYANANLTAVARDDPQGAAAEMNIRNGRYYGGGNATGSLRDLAEWGGTGDPVADPAFYKQDKPLPPDSGPFGTYYPPKPGDPAVLGSKVWTSSGRRPMRIITPRCVVLTRRTAVTIGRGDRPMSLKDDLLRLPAPTFLPGWGTPPIAPVDLVPGTGEETVEVTIPRAFVLPLPDGRRCAFQPGTYLVPASVADHPTTKTNIALGPVRLRPADLVMEAVKRGELVIHVDPGVPCRAVLSDGTILHLSPAPGGYFLPASVARNLQPRPAPEAA